MKLRLPRNVVRLLAVVLLGLALPPGPAQAATPTILVWGDSISAGYGLDAGSGWVALLERRLKAQASDYTVVNGSVSGETTAGGLSRLPAALARYRPAIVLIELGGNDGLRGLAPDALRTNLERMCGLAKAAGATAVLFEMRIPVNYGPAYGEKFRKTFVDVAKQHRLPLVPFFLGAIANDPPRWFQDDGIHPNAAAQPLLLDAVWPTLEPLVGPTTAAASRRAVRP